MADYTDWDFAQIQINYLDWACDTAAEECAALNSRNIPIMVMEPIRGGRLATLPEPYAGKLRASNPDWSRPSWALRFVRRLPGVQVILSGMSTPVACTRCAYCTTECPQKLNIPKLMERYNHLKDVGYLTPPEIDETPENEKPQLSGLRQMHPSLSAKPADPGHNQLILRENGGIHQICGVEQAPVSSFWETAGCEIRRPPPE